MKRTKIATGYFNGVSFSPNSEEIVYGVAATFDYPPKSNLFREGIDGTGKVALSHDSISAYPLWGPKGQIVFVRQLGAKPRQYGPENQLFVMNEDGERISQVTHTKVDPLAQGLTPVAFSANGARLLTEFGGQDQGYGGRRQPRHRRGKETDRRSRDRLPGQRPDRRRVDDPRHHRPRLRPLAPEDRDRCPGAAVPKSCWWRAPTSPSWSE